MFGLTTGLGGERPLPCRVHRAILRNGNPKGRAVKVVNEQRGVLRNEDSRCLRWALTAARLCQVRGPVSLQQCFLIPRLSAPVPKVPITPLARHLELIHV
jgi:hypothetical protein